VKKLIVCLLFLALSGGIMLSAPGCLPSPYSVGNPDSLFSGFSLAWYLADHHYSSFIVHQDVNWDLVFEQRRDAALSLSEAEELFDLTCDMFSTLSDGQIFFYRDSTFFPTCDPGRFVNFDRGVWEDYMTGWGAQTRLHILDNHGADRAGQHGRLCLHRVPSRLAGPVPGSVL